MVYAADIAWKLALVDRGAARPSLLDSYAAERGIADHHVLEVSDEVHSFVMNLIAMCDGGAPTAPTLDPAKDMAAARRRCMLDISYAGSALMGQAGAVVDGLSPGTRFPACSDLSGTCHHLIAFDGAPRLDYLRARWNKLVSIVDAPRAAYSSGSINQMQFNEIMNALENYEATQYQSARDTEGSIGVLPY